MMLLTPSRILRFVPKVSTLPTEAPKMPVFLVQTVLHASKARILPIFARRKKNVPQAQQAQLTQPLALLENIVLKEQELDLHVQLGIIVLLKQKSQSNVQQPLTAFLVAQQPFPAQSGQSPPIIQITLTSAADVKTASKAPTSALPASQYAYPASQATSVLAELPSNFQPMKSLTKDTNARQATIALKGPTKTYLVQLALTTLSLEGAL